MFLRIAKLLNADQIAQIVAMMDGARYKEGRETGGAAIQDIKNNQQVDRENSDGVAEADKLLLAALAGNGSLRASVLPKRILPPYYVKYTPGMAYGAHVDNPMMAAETGGPALRTDVSVTVFLNAPEDYDGGELQIKGDMGDAKIKLPAGDAVVYPTGAIHQVLPVTEGERRVAVSWMQSMIADPTRRRIVYELDLVCQSLHAKMPNSDEHRALMRNYGNLLRLWAEP